MSWFDVFCCKMAESDCKNYKAHVGSLKGDLGPKLTSGGQF